MESRIGGIRAWRNLWAEKFLCERSECGLRKFSEPEAGEAARGFARTAVDQDRKDSKSTKNDVLLQSGAKRSILLGDTEGGQAAGQADPQLIDDCLYACSGRRASAASDGGSLIASAVTTMSSSRLFLPAASVTYTVIAANHCPS